MARLIPTALILRNQSKLKVTYELDLVEIEFR